MWMQPSVIHSLEPGRGTSYWGWRVNIYPVCLRLSSFLGCETSATNTSLLPGKPAWSLSLLNKKFTISWKSFPIVFKSCLTHCMKTDNLRISFFLPGVSSKIQWTLVERIFPIPPASCCPLVWWKNLGRPAPHTCEVFLRPPPLSFAAAAVALRVTEDAHTVCAFSYFGVHVPRLCLARAGGAGALGSLQATHSWIYQVLCNSCYLNQLGPANSSKGRVLRECAGRTPDKPVSARLNRPICMCSVLIVLEGVGSGGDGVFPQLSR